VGYTTTVLATVLVASSALASAPGPEAPAFDARIALQASQAAIGRPLPPDLAITDQLGRRRTLAEFRSRPLVISPIYTSCFGVCPTTTVYLRKMVGMARAVLGPDSFAVLTIGFDTENDTPARMREYALARGIDSPDWVFGSADQATMQALVKLLGFTYVANSRGFDHMVQATVVDAEGIVFRQVYGQEFEPPLLVDPLKRLVLGLTIREDTLESAIRGVRLFCTVFDPKSGRYRFDWSLVLSIAIGVMCFTGVAVFLWRSWRRES
jgi:protein SCO1/2